VKIPALLGADSEVSISYIGRKSPWIVPTIGDQIVVTSDDTNLTNVFWVQTDGTTGSPTSDPLKANIASPTFTGTVSGITKSMVGLGSVDNTADTAKPVSTAQQTALNLKANLASPTFTGGNITVSGSGNTSMTVNAGAGSYAMQYFAVNGTNQWHYEVTPSGQSWALVESGVAQRLTVSETSGNLKLETGQVISPNQYCYNGDGTGQAATAFNGESVKPNNTYFNVGSLYNVSNGRFTVPIAGYVFCSFNSLITRNLNTSHAYVEFQVDGVRKSVRNHTMYDIGGSYTNLSNSAIVYCPANSYVTCNLWTPQASSYGDQYGLGLTFRFLG